jgi:spore coat polysaccharide biosynthesis protein SpsF (cytidylyltransferase family)
MSSTRLPGKVMLPLATRPVVEQVFRQLSFSRSLRSTILATSVDPSDQPLVSWAETNKIVFYRGNLEDVLDRYYQTAQMAHADTIVRITADCPLIDPEIVDRVVDKLISGDWDYVSNTNPPTFPDGLDVEAFSFEALTEAWREAKLKSDREHVTPYIRRNAYFKKYNVCSPKPYDCFRWTLDEPEDYSLLSVIYNRLYDAEKPILLHDVLTLLDQNPFLGRINSRLVRNEGYLKSLLEDERNEKSSKKP